jgi:hypothetical protein
VTSVRAGLIGCRLDQHGWVGGAVSTPSIFFKAEINAMSTRHLFRKGDHIRLRSPTLSGWQGEGIVACDQTESDHTVSFVKLGTEDDTGCADVSEVELVAHDLVEVEIIQRAETWEVWLHRGPGMGDTKGSIESTWATLRDAYLHVLDELKYRGPIKLDEGVSTS